MEIGQFLRYVLVLKIIVIIYQLKRHGNILTATPLTKAAYVDGSLSSGRPQTVLHVLEL